MDHHCPWTNNCVSHTTFPHFLRFLFYTTLGLSLLESFIFTRLSYLWTNMDMPSSLGPTPFQLAHLFTVLFVNSITLFILGVLFLRNIWCLAVNTTTIEGWEIERHKTLLRRARQYGGYLPSPDGTQQIRIRRQEFPYDIGIWANIVQGMNSANPISWFNPFSATPSLASGLVFETNGFEDEGTVWPPPDPDRAYRRKEKAANADAFRFTEAPDMSAEETVKAFKARQAEDALRRRRVYGEQVQQRVLDDEQEHNDGADDEGYTYGDDASDDAEEEEEPANKYDNKGREGEAAWRNAEGERLKDFGVDEDVEFYDEQEDDIPLSQLMARRRAASASGYSRS
jgi:palmitoyltransferase